MYRDVHLQMLESMLGYWPYLISPGLEHSNILHVLFGGTADAALTIVGVRISCMSNKRPVNIEICYQESCPVYHGPFLNADSQ